MSGKTETIDDVVVDKYVHKPLFSSDLFNAILAVLTGVDDTSSRVERQRKEWGKEWRDNQLGKKYPNNRLASEGTHEGASGIVLVAEDNRVNQIVVGEILAQAGIRYEIVENGRLAYEAIAKTSYALILMDCQMPEVDGFQATRRIREMERGDAADGNAVKPAHSGRIPIIALTANATREDEEHCLAAGMDAYCSKPVNAAQLVETVQNWLRD